MCVKISLSLSLSLPSCPSYFLGLHNHKCHLLLIVTPLVLHTNATRDPIPTLPSHRLFSNFLQKIFIVVHNASKEVFVNVLSMPSMTTMVNPTPFFYVICPLEDR